jgi:hypothetical protein
MTKSLQLPKLPGNPSRKLLERAATAAAIWAVGKLFEVRPVGRTAERVNAQAFRAHEKTELTLSEARRNVTRRPALLAGSAIAFAVGFGLLLHAASATDESPSPQVRVPTPDIV